ncbi:MFS transporter [Rubrivivax sp. RP6-9]|uniref:MFS transporter n=1 Tax=Rubrivivax sp. RP6-9 TaxID=3415750 RepID=UPI003CC5D9BD
MDRLPVTALHVLAVALCTFGFMFDLIEIGLGNVLVAVFSTPEKALAPGQLSMLLSSVYVGAIVGAPVLGALADRIGRRVTLAGALLLLSAASLWAALGDGIVSLTAARAVSGLALGAFPPLMFSYLTDLLPPRRRGLLILVVTGIASLGLPASLFLVRALTPLDLPLEPWRIAFIVGTAGSALAAALFVLLPESPRWLAARGRADDAERACARFEASRPVWQETAGGSVAAASAAAAQDLPRPPNWFQVGGLFLLSAWATVAFPLMTGAVLTAKGFDLKDTLLYVGLSTLGPTVGTFLASFWIDRIERRRALALCALVLLLSGGLFVATGSAAWLIASSFAFALFSVIYTAALNIYAAELFPTGRRARSVATAWAFNRVGAAVAPLALLPLLRAEGPLAMYGLVVACLLASMALLAFSPPGQERRSVA